MHLEGKVRGLVSVPLPCSFGLVVRFSPWYGLVNGDLAGR